MLFPRIIFFLPFLVSYTKSKPTFII
ncbi:uncharacterized protein Dyak_GE28134 [Drosophila yakuba]|uniref:Uncharacterized protein n=2 Tax=Drosophila yakuba TaxID=7245 RepID=A0A0R1DS83_DROYA|nr:uncharacterized protein Dyak_GE28134 [Drosophila yakuba]